jgi:hypothetical protein
MAEVEDGGRFMGRAWWTGRKLRRERWWRLRDYRRGWVRPMMNGRRIRDGARARGADGYGCSSHYQMDEEADGEPTDPKRMIHIESWVDPTVGKIIGMTSWCRFHLVEIHSSPVSF